MILDSISTNRIMLKVQLCASYYHVIQGDRLDGAIEQARRTKPDLIICAMNLPDGTALELLAQLRKDDDLARIPLLTVTAENDRTARMQALSGGVDDVLSQPLDDMLLQARIRKLIRDRSNRDDIVPRGTDVYRSPTEGPPGFRDKVQLFTRSARVAVLTRRAATACHWAEGLRSNRNLLVSTHGKDDIVNLMTEPAPDAYIVEVSDSMRQDGLRIIADLRARQSSRKAVVIAVTEPANARRAAEALDRGAHDVLQDGFHATELMLRLTQQLLRKHEADRMRANLRRHLRDAQRDPMTGLYNRRYALPFLSRIVSDATRTGTPCAVMLADLDHFKRINDQFGHAAGDAVLTETSVRLRKCLRPCDLIGRIGGEEFLIAAPDTDKSAALKLADRLRHVINSAPFWLPETDRAVRVTVSIGVTMGPRPNQAVAGPELGARQLLNMADRALYAAKDGGRDKVTLDYNPI